MDYSGWSMIPNVQAHINSPTTSNQDHLFVHQQQQQQQLHHQQQQQQQQQQLQQLQQQHHYQQQQQQQRVHYQQQQQQQQQQHHHPSLASHFHLLLLVENLADAIENGTRDQHPVLVNELNSHFEKCQQLLNSISGSINTKAMTVEGQKRKLEESEHLLNQRRDLIAKYRNSVEELIKYEP